MKKTRKIIPFLFLLALAVLTLCVPAFALTESEVEAQVAATSKAEVSGNVLIWFLCAVAFLKVSQKVDSFMSSLGINVGHTGGSLLSEAMIAMKSVTMVTGGGRAAGGGRRTGAASGSSSNNSGWFLKGGLAGVASRKITNSAIKTATTQTSAVQSAQSEIRHAAAAAASAQTSVQSSAQSSPGTRANNPVHTSTSATATHSTSANRVSNVPLGTPPQEGVIVTNNNGGPSAPPVGSAPSASPPSSSIPPLEAPPQEGVIITSATGEHDVPPIGNISPDSSLSDGSPFQETPPQDGTVITSGNGETAAPPIASAPPDSPQPDGIPFQEMPFQEGTVITSGNGVPAASPIESTPPDTSIPVNEFYTPSHIDFSHGRYICIDGVYYAYLLIPSSGYKSQVPAGWLSLLVNAGDGIDLDMFLTRQPKDRMIRKLGQQLRINRSKIKETSDTNTDFDDLDGAIRSGYFLKDGLGNNEDFYYLNLLVTITAYNVDDLEWKCAEMKKLLLSQDMDVQTCSFCQEQAFLSSLPLVSLERRLYERSKRNVLTLGAASCYPFTSYEMCDDNGILLGVNKHNNSLIIVDIFDSRVYKNANIAILGTSGAGKSFTMQLMATRMRRKGIQVFIVR